MKKGSELFVKMTATVLSLIMLSVMIVTTVFAGGLGDSFTHTPSLADFLGLGDDERVEVIVKFDSPSILERKLSASSSYAASYEQKLISEQNTVLDQFDITPHYRYTSVLNAVAMTATGEEIRELEKTQGVAGVYLPDTYETPETEESLQPYAAMSSEMIGTDAFVATGYTGDGVVVAVIDSGVDLDHEAFQNTKYVTEPVLTPEKLIELGFGSSAGYYNAKIPFYFDYIDFTSAGYGDPRGHGSHVGGIIGGYAENEDGTVKFSGIAPGVQLCAMRILNEKGQGTQMALLAALEDAYKLGVDIVNLSLGSDSGFREDTAYRLTLDGIFEDLEEAGIMVICAAGNSSGTHIYTLQRLLDNGYMDYGTLASPAIYPGNVGVGSVDNLKTSGPVIKIGGSAYPYSDPFGSQGLLSFMARFNGKTVDIVYANTYGKAEDYESLDVKGKIVAVHRGELSFTDKCQYAAAAGAIGLIVINYEGDAVVGMSIDNQTLPAILVDYGIVAHLPITDYVASLEIAEVDSPTAGQVSSFSSIGVTPDLEIGLDIVGVGGSVLSVQANSRNGYVVQSGTSMAAPCAAGAYALLYERLMDEGILEEMTPSEISEFMDDVTQSTAKILASKDGYYSPRFQGAGLIDINAANAAEAYIDNPVISLGYDENAGGKISMEYVLVSRSTSDKHYYALPSAVTDAFTQVSASDFKNSVSPLMFGPQDYTYQTYVDGVVVGSDGVITLPAGERVTVRIDLELAPNVAAALLSIYPNGYFLDGFVEFYDVNDLSGSAMHGSYVSFVGDWLAGAAIEPLTEIELMDWLYKMGMDPYASLPDFQSMYPNANFSYTTLLLGKDSNYHIGQNPIAPQQYVPLNPDRHAISAPISNADRVIYDTALLKPSFLRNCKRVEYVMTNSETGEVYGRRVQEYVSKDVYMGNMEYFSRSDFPIKASYMAANERGEMVEKYIPSGTDVTISVYTLLDHPNATERLEMVYELTVDYTAPEVYYTYDADTKQLTVSCFDTEYLAGMLLQEINESFLIDDTIDRCVYADETPGVMHTEVFDLSDYAYDYVNLTVSDYAGNGVVQYLSLDSGDISNVEVGVTVGATSGIDVDFEDELYLYQEVDFSVVPAEGYCFSEDFVILLNETALVPVAVENGVYHYSITLDVAELEITAQGVMQHSYVPTVTKAATCLSEGELSRICANCSHVGGAEVIPPVGHQSGDPVTAIEATCTVPGLATVSCTECSMILATQAIPVKDHTPGEFVVVLDATCAESGLKVQSCTVCGEGLDTESIAVKDHTPGEFVITQEATCTEEGLKVKTCKVCELVLDTESIAAKGHTPGEFVTIQEATCTESGLKIKTCKACGLILATETIASKAHTPGTPVTVVEATCTEEGLAAIACTECKAIINAQTVPANGHLPGEFIVAFEATCTGAGLKYQCCDDCGQMLGSEKIAPLGHTPSELITTKEATCAESGLKVKTCTACQKTLETEIIPAKGHTNGTPTTFLPATCTDSGIEVTKCIDCDSIVLTTILPASGHDSATGKQASAFSPAVCGVCGESYGSADSTVIIVIALALSSVSVAALIVAAAVTVIRKKK